MDRRTLMAGGLAVGAGLMMPGATGGNTSLEELTDVTRQLREAMDVSSQSRQLRRLQEHVANIADVMASARRRGDLQAAALVFAEASYLHARAAGDAIDFSEQHHAASNIIHAAAPARDDDLQAIGWIQMAAVKLHGADDYRMAAWAAHRASGLARAGTLKAWAACTEAMALARHPGPRAGEVLEALDRAADDVTGEPSRWHPYTTPEHVENFRGALLTRVDRADEGTLILEGLTRENFGAGTYQRMHLLNDLVSAYVVQREVEGAVLTAHEVLDLAVATDSPFQIRRLRKLTRPLEVYAGQRDVDGLHDRLATMYV